MRTKVTSIVKLKALFVEMFLNNTNNVTKVSDGSVMNGTAYGVAKVGQKVEKDIALLESRKFPSSAFGQYLDDVGFEYGVSTRFGATGSSTFILLVGNVGTTYLAATHFFSGNHNVTFELVADVTIPAIGYTYAQVRSTSNGERTNVDALTITQVTPTPAGHNYVINEFGAFGGMDAEDDDAYRLRIMETPSIVSMDTLGRLTQVFIKINSKTMRLFYYGINEFGKTVIAVLAQDGTPFSGSELNDFVVQSETYLSLSDLRPFGSSTYGIEVVNISWHTIDMDFRVNLHGSYNPDDVRKEMQVAINKYLDYRFWTPNLDRVEWDDMLQIIKGIEGVRYVPDNYFIPQNDIEISPIKLPRIQGFKVRDMDGVLIADGSGALNPTYFPQTVSYSFITTALVTV